MYDKETQQKIASCKALQGMTVEDFIKNDRFRENLAGYLTEQRETRKTARASYAAMRKVGGAKGYKLPAHVCDKFIDVTVDQFAELFMAVIAKRYNGPLAEREYIRQLGMQAYNLTVAQYVVEEYPELADKLIPKSKAN